MQKPSKKSSISFTIPFHQLAWLNFLLKIIKTSKKPSKSRKQKSLQSFQKLSNPSTYFKLHFSLSSPVHQLNASDFLHDETQQKRRATWGFFSTYKPVVRLCRCRAEKKEEKRANEKNFRLFSTPTHAPHHV